MLRSVVLVIAWPTGHLVSAWSSAETSAASAAPIRWKISSACRSLPSAMEMRPAAISHRPWPASAWVSSQELPWRPGPGPAGGPTCGRDCPASYSRRGTGWPRRLRQLFRLFYVAASSLPGKLFNAHANHSIVCILRPRPRGPGLSRGRSGSHDRGFAVPLSCGHRVRGRSAAGGRSGGHPGLARTSARTLARHDRAAQQQLAAPDTPGLPARERTGQAVDPGPASPAHGLRQLHILRRFGEEQLRVLRARKIESYRERGGLAGHHELIRCSDLAPSSTWATVRRASSESDSLFGRPGRGWPEGIT